MIDLSEAIRTTVLSITGVSTLLPAYLGSKPMFTRRPAPADAPFPQGFVSPLIDDSDVGFVDKEAHILAYYLSFYGHNETPETYRAVEDMSFAAVRFFSRMDRTLMTMPAGWYLVNSAASGPRPAPVDDDKLVGRVVALRLMVKQG